MNNEAIFVEKLRVFATAVALINPCPLSDTPDKAKNDPVPGPNIPSYQPIAGTMIF